MRIERIEVSGFGALRDVSYDLTDKPSVILFYGRNEAGKSTMLQFVRSMLFGFPPRSQLADRYEPEAGGAHGGALVLRDAAGRMIRLERYAATTSGGKRPSAGVPVITLDDGTRGGEELLPMIVGDLTAHMYRQLFAFGLDELQELRTLHSDELSAYLFSTGLGLSGGAVLDAEKRLTAEMEQMFKPRGRKQSLNMLTDELEQIEGELRHYRDNVHTYKQLTAQIERLDDEISELEHNVQSADRQLIWYDQCRQARDPWQTMRAAELELAELPDLSSFPEDAIRRFEEETQRMEELTHRHRLLSEQLGQIKDRMNSITSDHQRLHKLQEVEDLQEQSAVIHSTLDEKRAAEEELTRIQTQVEAQIVAIDSRWTEQDVLRLPSSLEERADISSFRSKLQEFAQRSEFELAELTRLQREHKRMVTKAEEIATEAREAQRLLDSMEVSGANEWRSLAPEQRRKKLKRLRGALDEWRACLLEESLTERRKQEEHKRTNSLTKLLIVFIAVNVLLPVLLYLMNEPELALTSAGLLVLMNLVLFAIWRNLRTAAHRSSADSTSRLRQIAVEVGGMLPTLLPVHMDHMDQAAASREERHVLRRGKDHSWTLAEAEALAEQLELSLEQLQSAEDDVQQWQRKQNEAQRQVSELAAMIQEQEVRLSAVRHEQEETQAQWQAWLRERNLSLRLQPDTAAELLSRCEQVKQLITHRDDLKERIAGYTKRVQAFEHQVKQLAEILAEPLHPEESAMNVVRRLLALLRKEAEQEKERNALTAQYEELNAEWSELSERLRQGESRIAALWEEAGAEEEAQFRKRAAQHARSRELKQQIQEAHSRLEWLAGAAELDKLKEDLAAIGGAELERRRVETVERSAAMKQAIADKREMRGKLLSELEKVEEGAEHAELLQRKQEKLTALHKQASQYMARSLAGELLRRTRELYERERQPQVLQAASHYLHLITGGRYERVLAPFGEQRLTVVRSDGRQLDTAYLSRGTAEQLYLAMRFALIEAYSASRAALQASLPLIMDDIFVNFDEQRTAYCLDVVGEISASRQVLMFTCHDHLRQLIGKRLPNATCIEL